MKTTRKALIVGARGGIGYATAQALLQHGWQVRGLTRTPPAHDRSALEWVRGDVMNRDDLWQAADGVDVIVHAVNPPGYRGWNRRVLPMLEQTIAAAGQAGARIVLPGTIYNYGPDAFPLLAENSPQHPVTQKGAVRVAMEQRLQQAAGQGIPCLILRCGDFLGPRPGNNWFTQALVAPGKPVRKVRYPGPLDIGHAWAYLPDVAQTLARLLDRADELADFTRFHFPGYWLDGATMLGLIRRAAGRPDIVAARFPWWLATLAAPFHETLRELRELRYLWQRPIRLDGTSLRRALGEVPCTPPEQAIRATLEGAGCLARRDGSGRPRRAAQYQPSNDTPTPT